MFGGGGGLDPRKMQQMMKQMGVDFDELDATEVLIRMEGGEELYFDDADVTKIEAQGQTTYQVVGDPTTREGGETATGDEAADTAEAGGAGVEDQDVEIVVERTGASEAAAREALEEADGDLAAAIAELE